MADGALYSTIQLSDRFNLGSVSKVFTGNLMGKLIQDGVGNLQWGTKLIDVYPRSSSIPGARTSMRTSPSSSFWRTPRACPYSRTGDDASAYLSWTAADLTKEKLKQRRRQYMNAQTSSCWDAF